MLKKTLTFEDLDGNKVTEDFYFHFSKAEIAEMELTFPGGLAAHMQKVIDQQNGAEIISTFKRFILEAYGKRSEDGRRFIKSKEMSEEFMQTDAYSEYFMELCTDAKAGAEFVRGIFPGGETVQLPENISDLTLPTVKAEGETSTVIEKKDPKDMTIEELRAAYAEREKS